MEMLFDVAMRKGKKKAKRDITILVSLTLSLALVSLVRFR